MFYTFIRVGGGKLKKHPDKQKYNSWRAIKEMN